jgi:PST family polysaccharide transporter
MTDGRSTIGNFSWAAAEGLSRQILAMIFFFWIARYVTPQDVGIFSLALSINLMLFVILDEPATEALIQRPTVDETHWSTAFWTNLALACTVLLILAASGPTVAQLIGHPEVGLLFPVLALTSVFGAMGNIHRAHLIRRQHFKLNAAVALVGQMVGGTVTVLMAVRGFGVWALALNVVLSAALTSTLYWFVSGWRPRLVWSRVAARDLVWIAAHVTTLRSVVLLRDQGTFLLVGLLSGSTVLGYFNLAFRIVRSVAQLLEDVLNRVGLSVVSRVQQDRSEFAALTTRLTTITALVGLPCIAGLFMVGPDALVVFFGPQWGPSGPILQLMCVLAALQLVQHALGLPVRSLGHQRAIVRLVAPLAALDLVIVALLARHSIEAMLAVLIVRNIAVLPQYALLLRRHTTIAAMRLVRAALLPLGATVFMAIAVAVVAMYFNASPTMKLAATVAAGAATYVVVLLSGIQVRRMAGWSWLP